MSERSAPIVLFGFTGTGKSVVGQILAQRLKRKFFDSDKEIARETGCSLPEIAARQDETTFQRLETQAIARLAEKDSAVIACGSGAVLRAENLAALRRNGSIHFVLTASVPAILARTAGSNRPLLQGTAAERLAKIAVRLAQRADAYARAGLAIATDGQTPKEVAEAIVRLLRAGARASAAGDH